MLGRFFARVGAVGFGRTYQICNLLTAAAILLYYLSLDSQKNLEKKGLGVLVCSFFHLYMACYDLLARYFDHDLNHDLIRKITWSAFPTIYPSFLFGERLLKEESDRCLPNSLVLVSLISLIVTVEELSRLEIPNFLWDPFRNDVRQFFHQVFHNNQNLEPNRITRD